jgi:hypothetical protein
MVEGGRHETAMDRGHEHRSRKTSECVAGVWLRHPNETSLQGGPTIRMADMGWGEEGSRDPWKKLL